jgi:hypothetical protein
MTLKTAGGSQNTDCGQDNIRYDTPWNTIIEGGHVIIIAGGLSDAITAQHAASIILGDVGIIRYRDLAPSSIGFQLQYVEAWTTFLWRIDGDGSHPWAKTYHRDRITLIDTSSSVIMGGHDEDTIEVKSSLPIDTLMNLNQYVISIPSPVPNVIVCGDYCMVTASNGNITSVVSNTNADSSLVLYSTLNDIIDVRAARLAIVMGNEGHDQIWSGSGADLVCGDHCDIRFDIVTDVACGSTLLPHGPNCLRLVYTYSLNVLDYD